MTRLNHLSIVFAALAVLLLSACQTSGGYGSYRNWGSTPAERPPKTLSEQYKQQAPQGSEIYAEQPEAYQPAKARDLPAVKVALLLPLSGQHSALGQAMLNAAQIGLFDVGHSGFELLPKDTKSTPEGARQAAQEAVNAGAELILGPVFSEAVQSVKPVTRGANINMIAFSTNWQLAGGNTFIMGFLPFDQVERITTYAAIQSLNNVAVIAPQTEYGQAVVSTYGAIARQHGIYTADKVLFPPETANLAPTMRSFTQYDERILKARMDAGIPDTDQKTKVDLLAYPPPFDAVLMPVGGQMALSVSNLLSHYDLPPSRVKRLGTGLLDDLGIAAENSLDGAWFAAPSPKLRRGFESRYFQTYGKKPPRLASLSYDATALAAILAKRGLQSQGQPSFNREAISNPNGFAGIDGIFRFRRNGTAERGLAILEINNGEIRVIDEAPRTFQQMRY